MEGCFISLNEGRSPNSLTGLHWHNGKKPYFTASETGSPSSLLGHLWQYPGEGNELFHYSLSNMEAYTLLSAIVGKTWGGVISFFPWGWSEIQQLFSNSIFLTKLPFLIFIYICFCLCFVCVYFLERSLSRRKFLHHYSSVPGFL